MLATSIQTIKDTIKRLEQAHAVTMDKAKMAMASELEVARDRAAPCSVPFGQS